jgi:hypothetical protein
VAILRTPWEVFAHVLFYDFIVTTGSGGGAGSNIASTTASNQLSQNSAMIASLLVSGLNSPASIAQYGNTGGSSATWPSNGGSTYLVNSFTHSYIVTHLHSLLRKGGGGGGAGGPGLPGTTTANGLS